MQSPDFDYLANYQGKCADSSRLAFLTILVVDPDIPEFLRTYFQLGLKYPEVYLDAFLVLTYEARYPFSTIDGYNAWNSAYIGTDTSLYGCGVEPPGQLNSKIPWLFDILWKISRFNVLQSNPLTAWTVSVPFCLWTFVLVLARAFIKRRKEVIVPSLLILFMVFTLLLGPMVLIRYYLFVFYLLPAFLFYLFKYSPSRETHTKE